MARAKTAEQSRLRSKAATMEELSRGVGYLQEFLAKVEDLGREGFPYLDATRARTELQFRECLRRIFGEKSLEFQEHRQHKLLMGNPEETQQSLALIKTLIATLEQKKRELQGAPPLAQTPPTPVRPQMTVVPPSIPTVQMTMMQTAPITPPPVVMAVAMTTNLDLSSAAAIATPSPLGPVSPASLGKQEPPSSPTSQPEPSASSPASPAAVMPDLPPQPVTQPTAAPLHRPSHTPEQAQADSAHFIRPLQPPHHEPEPIMHATPSARLASQVQEPLPTQLQPSPSKPAGASLHQEPVSQPLQSGSSPVELVKTLCGRFHAVARQLRLRGEYRATLSVEDEFDAQDLLHALLRIQFDDIGTDEWMPSYAEGAPRTTLLLNDGRLAVIVKKTRPGLNGKDLGDQLRIDSERYRSRDHCSTLLCFMYDPEGRIGNPRGLESSLTSVNESFMIDVLVAPK